MIVLLWFGMACEVPVEDCISGPPGPERDACLHAEIMALPADGLSQLETLAHQISDPVYRGSAVFDWVSAHNREITPEQAQKACSFLQGTVRQMCERRAQAAHLNGEAVPIDAPERDKK